MGTASLIFGIILVIIGAGLGIVWLSWAPSGFAEEGPVPTIIAGLIVLVPMFVIGGLLLRSYDKDKKKEKSENPVDHIKKKYSVEELNKINELRWKNNPIPKDFLHDIHALREANVDEDEIEQIMLSHGFEGKNVDEKGESYWVCGHCNNKIRFKTREDYINHHFRVHS